MISKVTGLRKWSALSAAVFTVGTTASTVAVSPVMAQTPHKTFAQKHHKLAGIATGVAAYKIAKKTGKNRVAAGGRKNFAQKHPMLTGVAAGVAVNHHLKKR
jgi:hypothetical protein